MFYEQQITKVTGIADPAAVAEIQAEMRSNLTGLDHLTARQFNTLAREAAGTCASLASRATSR